MNKANKKGKTAEQELGEASSLAQRIEEMKIKKEQMAKDIEAKRNVTFEHSGDQVKWKLFLSSILSKLYGSKMDSDFLTNSDEVFFFNINQKSCVRKLMK